MITVYYFIAVLLVAEFVVLLGLLLPIRVVNKLVISLLWKSRTYLNGILIFLVLFSAYETQDLVMRKKTIIRHLQEILIFLFSDSIDYYYCSYQQFSPEF
jgi:hypothetical protein